MKFEIRFYRLESDIMKEYKTVTVNQDILVTSLIQIEAKNLCPFKGLASIPNLKTFINELEREW
nr:MAG TPA: hypothetical protein [Caudoviricetes sp.]